MSAVVVRLPIGMKRGRKVTRGPIATLHRLYEAPSISNDFAMQEQQKTVDELLALRRVREVERQAQALAWIELSANVRKWPDGKRHRSVELVRVLREGGEDVEPEQPSDLGEARRQFLHEVQDRFHEILAQAKSRGGNHG